MIALAFLKSLGVCFLFQFGGMIWFYSRPTFCEFQDDEDDLREKVQWLCVLLSFLALYFV